MAKNIKSVNKSQEIECKTLKNILFASEITYAQIAKKIGISENAVNFKINGKRSWWIEECVLVTKLLGYSDLIEVFPEIVEKYLKSA